MHALLVKPEICSRCSLIVIICTFALPFLLYKLCVTICCQVTEGEVVALIQRLNGDPNVHAILLQLPLDSENPIDADRCTNTIDINKVQLPGTQC